jgi:hypothetical protein
MRVFLTTSVDTTKQIWRDGWWDIHEEFGMSGVCLADAQLDANDGFLGDVTVCIDVPEGVFAQYEIDDPIHNYREAIVPADVLNGLDKPKVYDHEYAGSSRRQLLKAAEHWEAGDVRSHQHANEMREAIRFFDEIGWLTPLKIQEQDG